MNLLLKPTIETTETIVTTETLTTCNLKPVTCNLKFKSILNSSILVVNGSNSSVNAWIWYVNGKLVVADIHSNMQVNNKNRVGSVILVEDYGMKLFMLLVFFE